MFKEIIAVLGISVFAFSTHAATLIVDGAGQLTGATGVEVNGAFYDVSFLDGTCPELFNGCDSDDDYTFSEYDAPLASQALLDQVAVNTARGAFDNDGGLTAGCIVPNSSCLMYTVFARGSLGWRVSIAVNNRAGWPTDDFVMYDNHTITDGRPGDGQVHVYAVWAPSPVPIPASAWLFMTALLALVGKKRLA